MNRFVEDILGLGLLWWENGLVIWGKSESFGFVEDVLGGENPLLNLLLQESISLFENIVVIAWFGLRFGCLEKVGSEDAFGIRFWILGCQTLRTREFVLVGLEIEKTVDSLFGELNRVWDFCCFCYNYYYFEFGDGGFELFTLWWS